MCGLVPNQSNKLLLRRFFVFVEVSTAFFGGKRWIHTSNTSPDTLLLLQHSMSGRGATVGHHTPGHVSKGACARHRVTTTVLSWQSVRGHRLVVMDIRVQEGIGRVSKQNGLPRRKFFFCSCPRTLRERFIRRGGPLQNPVGSESVVLAYPDASFFSIISIWVPGILEISPPMSSC